MWWLWLPTLASHVLPLALIYLVRVRKREKHGDQGIDVYPAAPACCMRSRGHAHSDSNGHAYGDSCSYRYPYTYAHGYA